MQDTRFVMYETCNAIFTFEIADAISHLKPYAEQGIREATELLEAFFATPSPPLIPQRRCVIINRPFGDKR